MRADSKFCVGYSTKFLRTNFTQFSGNLEETNTPHTRKPLPSRKTRNCGLDDFSQGYRGTFTTNFIDTCSDTVYLFSTPILGYPRYFPIPYLAQTDEYPAHGLEIERFVAVEYQNKAA